jgi:hypothetical protein
MNIVKAIRAAAAEVRGTTAEEPGLVDLTNEPSPTVSASVG